MRIVIVTLGTRGSIQPYLYLTQSLLKSGHHVSFVTTSEHEDIVLETSDRIAFYSLHGNIKKILQDEKIVQSMNEGNIFAVPKEANKEMHQYWSQNVQILARVCESADVLIVHGSAISLGATVGEVKRIPTIVATTLGPPLYPTAQFPPPLFRAKPYFLGFLNKILYPILTKVAISSWKIGKAINEFRQSNHFQPIRVQEFFARTTLLTQALTYSTTIVPIPSEWKQDDRIDFHETGFWLDPRDSQDYFPSFSLVKFLKFGSKPIYFGWGSSPILNPTQLITLILTTLHQTKQRGILQRSSLGGTTSLGRHLLPTTIENYEQIKKYADENVFEVDEIPHNWLFPHCSVIVHHGGSGTLGAAFQAGVPQLVLATHVFFGLADFWGYRVQRLGVGQTIQLRNLTTTTQLIQFITEILQPSYLQRAKEIQHVLEQENGIKRTVALIETFKWKEKKENYWPRIYHLENQQKKRRRFLRVLTLSLGVAIAVGTTITFRPDLLGKKK